MERFADESTVTKFLVHVLPNPNCPNLHLTSALVVSASYKLFYADRPNDMIVPHVIVRAYFLDVSTTANTRFPPEWAHHKAIPDTYYGGEKQCRKTPV